MELAFKRMRVEREDMAASSAPAGLDLERFEALLRERLAVLQNAARALESAEAEGPALEWGELGAVLSAHEVDLSCGESIAREIRDVGEALDRVHAGTYGICEACGGSLSKERLEAIPYAKLCLACKKAEEQALNAA